MRRNTWKPQPDDDHKEMLQTAIFRICRACWLCSATSVARAAVVVAETVAEAMTEAVTEAVAKAFAVVEAVAVAGVAEWLKRLRWQCCGHLTVEDPERKKLDPKGHGR
eukprot:scaffold10561_cov24-Tisochrysis_lutea.AAC.2